MRSPVALTWPFGETVRVGAPAACVKVTLPFCPVVASWSEKPEVASPVVVVEPVKGPTWTMVVAPTFKV